nr:MAG TPA: hypothetical protein [Caudoviricetes sp.]
MSSGGTIAHEQRRTKLGRPRSTSSECNQLGSGVPRGCGVG